MFEIIVQTQTYETVGKLDLFDNEIPLITRSKNWLSVDEQSALYSTQIKIPKTSNNVSLLQISKSGNIIATSYLSVAQYQEVPCIVRHYGIEVVQNMFIKLDKVDNDYIYLRLFEGKRILQTLINDTLISSLDFSSLDHQRSADILANITGFANNSVVYGIDKVPNGTFLGNGVINNGDVGSIDANLFDVTMQMQTLGVPGNDNNYGTFPLSRIYPKIKVNAILDAIASYLNISGAGVNINFIGTFPQKDNLLIDFTNENSTIYDRLQLCETIIETELDYEIPANTNTSSPTNPSHSQLIGCFNPKKQGVTYLGGVANLAFVNETVATSKANLKGMFISEPGDVTTFFFNIKCNASSTSTRPFNTFVKIANHIDIYISYNNGISKGKIGTARPIPTKTNFDNYFFQYTYIAGSSQDGDNLTFWAVSRGVYEDLSIADGQENWKDLPGSTGLPSDTQSDIPIKLLKGTSIKAKVLEYNKVWEVAKNLPKMTIKDFLAGICIHYGASYDIVKDVNGYSINVFQKNENTGVLDWSNKLVDNDYTQDNNENTPNQIRLDFNSESQKDSVLLTENAGAVQTPKTLLTSKFALSRPLYNRTVFVKSQPKNGGGTPYTTTANEYPNNYNKLFISGLGTPRDFNHSLEIIFEKNKKNPNILLIDTPLISDEKIIVYNDDLPSLTWQWVLSSSVVSIFDNPFINPKTIRKGFVLPAIDLVDGISGLNDIEVIKKQYKWLNEFMLNPLKFTMSVYLNLTDFLQFDFNKLVYIKQFESYFKVEKLGQWSPDKPLTVNFIKYTPKD